MVSEKLKITVETTAIRTRGWIRFSLAVVGVAAVLLAAFNMLLAPASGEAAILAGYRSYFEAVAVSDGGVIHLADVGLMGLGAILAWLS